MRKVDDGERKGKKRMSFLVATTSLPAVDRQNADRWNAARSRQFPTQKHSTIVMKVKVEILEGLLTQKHSMVVMKVKVEDMEGLGGQRRAGQRTGM